MAALQCEICGGKLMAKSGGLFECEYCGMQYDKTRIQEMVQEIKGTVKVEGTVQVAGTVKLDGAVHVEGSATENSLLCRAKVLLEESKWNDAKDVIHQVLSINPECSQAYIYEYLLENKIEREEELAYIEPGRYAIEKWNKLCQRVTEEYRARLQNYRSSRTTRLSQEAPPTRQLMERRRQAELLQDCLNGGAQQGYWVACSISGKLYCLITEDKASWVKEIETWPDGVVQLLCEKDWIIAVYADGTCRATVRDNPQLKCAVESWEDVKLAGCHADHILFLTYGGELSSYQWKETEKEIKNYYCASDWQNVERLVSCWDNNGKYVIGQTADGTLLSTAPLPAGLPTTEIRYFSKFFEYWIKRDGSCFIEESEDSWKEKLWPDQEELRLYRAGLSGSFGVGTAVITDGGTLVERWEKPPMIWQREMLDVLDCKRYLSRIDYILRTDGKLMQFGEHIFPNRKFVALLNRVPWFAAVDTEGHITILGDVYGDKEYTLVNAEICRWKMFNSVDTIEQEVFEFKAQREKLRKQAAQRRLEEKIRREAEAERRREEQLLKLRKEKSALEKELVELKGFFSGKRRKEIEARLAKIETELKGLS